MTDAAERQDVDQAARRVSRLLDRLRLRVVFAESCTAGLVSATLAQVAGISQWLCGSAVTYREATKVAWLGVDRNDLDRYSAVSESVARQMAAGALRRTPEAAVAAAVTGHLGPDAPEELDGVVYVGLAQRRDADRSEVTQVRRITLNSTERVARQREAAACVLLELETALTALLEQRNESSG